MAFVYLSIGSNIGNKEQNINKAIQYLKKEIGSVLKISSFYYSPPKDFESPNMFCNICLSLQTNFQPIDLLCHLQQIEKKMGREHHSQKQQYEDRIIDIDIILYDHLYINTPELTIPHPKYKERDFVLIPLYEIANKQEIEIPSSKIN